MEKSGFTPKPGQFFHGLIHLIKYKVLNHFGFKNISIFFDYLPWFLMARVVDHRYQISKQPYGIALSKNHPTQFRAFSNNRNQGESSPHSAGCQEY